MQTIAGEPFPTLKPFKAEFIAQVWTENQPYDKCMNLSFIDEELELSSGKGEILVNGVHLEDWINSQTTEHKTRAYRKLLKTMAISAVFGEDRYLKLKGETI